MCTHAGMGKGLAVIMAALALALGLSTAPALAHGDAEVAVSPTAAGASDTIQVSVEGFEADTLVRITLEGVNGSIPLGTLTTDGDGAGQASFTLPANLPAGSYALHAQGGDDNVTTDLSITAATAASTPSTGHEAISYSQPPAQVAGIVLAILIVAVAGAALVWRSGGGSPAHRRA